VAADIKGEKLKDVNYPKKGVKPLKRRPLEKRLLKRRPIKKGPLQRGKQNIEDGVNSIDVNTL